MKDFVWYPSEKIVEHARLTEFARVTGCRDFGELYRWSVTDIASFTESVIRFLNIQFDRPYSSILDLSAGLEWPRWCVDAELNIAASCLAHDSARIALIAESEDGTPEVLTYGRLREQVSRCSAGLRALGIRKGDRVAIYMPMRAETVIALLAITYAGAIAVPLFSGYGPTAIETRLNQTSAKTLIACDSFQRAGKRIDMLGNAQEALSRCRTVEHFVVFAAGPVPGAICWNELFTAEVIPYERTAAEDPLLIIFSSGTSGEPKGIVHSHCSFPVKAAQDMAFNMDIHGGDRISWITDLGWMMGPWLIYGGLLLGATVVLYEGACDWPDPLHSGPSRPNTGWRFSDCPRPWFASLLNTASRTRNRTISPLCAFLPLRANRGNPRPGGGFLKRCGVNPSRLSTIQEAPRSRAAFSRIIPSRQSRRVHSPPHALVLRPMSWTTAANRS